MNKINIFGFQIKLSFSIKRVKTLTFDLPQWADDVSITSFTEYNGEVEYSIRYFKASSLHIIPLPKCKKVNIIKLDSRYNIINGKKTNNTNRKIKLELIK